MYNPVSSLDRIAVPFRLLGPDYYPEYHTKDTSDAVAYNYNTISPIQPIQWLGQQDPSTHAIQQQLDQSLLNSVSTLEARNSFIPMEELLS